MTKWHSDILIVLVPGILRLIIHSFPTKKYSCTLFSSISNNDNLYLRDSGSWQRLHQVSNCTE